MKTLVRAQAAQLPLLGRAKEKERGLEAHTGEDIYIYILTPTNKVALKIGSLLFTSKR